MVEGELTPVDWSFERIPGERKFYFLENIEMDTLFELISFYMKVEIMLHLRVHSSISESSDYSKLQYNSHHSLSTASTSSHHAVSYSFSLLPTLPFSDGSQLQQRRTQQKIFSLEFLRMGLSSYDTLLPIRVSSSSPSGDRGEEKGREEGR